MSWARDSLQHCSPGYRFRHCIGMLYACNFYGMCVYKKKAKRAENFQGQEINLGKLLLVYSMRPQNLEALGAMRSFAEYWPI